MLLFGKRDKALKANSYPKALPSPHTRRKHTDTITQHDRGESFEVLGWQATCDQGDVQANFEHTNDEPKNQMVWAYSRAFLSVNMFSVGARQIKVCKRPNTLFQIPPTKIVLDCLPSVRYAGQILPSPYDA